LHYQLIYHLFLTDILNYLNIFISSLIIISDFHLILSITPSSYFLALDLSDLYLYDHRILQVFFYQKDQFY